MTPLEVYAQAADSDFAGHMAFLRNHARGNVLEIGVREGLSTAALLVGAAETNAHVWSVDLDDYSHLYDSPNWTFIQANSVTESERILDATNMRSNELWIDLLFIDGDHTYSGCMSDLTNFGKYAKIIAVHDTASSYIGVWQAVTEYFRSPFSGGFSRAEFRNESHGLGILYR